MLVWIKIWITHEQNYFSNLFNKFKKQQGNDCMLVCSHPSSMVTPCMMMELATLTFSLTVVEFPMVDLFMDVLSAIWHNAPMMISDPIWIHTLKHYGSVHHYYWTSCDRMEGNVALNDKTDWYFTWHLSEMTTDGWTAGSSNSFGAWQRRKRQ